jgi:hypothetical protein
MTLRTRHPGWTRRSLVVLCALALGSGNAFADKTRAPTAVPQAPASSQDSAPIPAPQLDSLVAPIALYPDPLLAQVLAASTYPLELIQLAQWLTRNAGLKGTALADAVAKQPWDPSVQAMAGLPDVVKWLTDDIQWTTDLGNAFLAQQADVMTAVQRMRQKAQAKGTLKSTEQQVVQTTTEGSTQVIVIEQSNPEVIYVPSYDPVVVYGSPVYPYPPIYYPPAGYYAGAAIGFGVGVAMGAFWGGGGWGWRPGWGNNDINVNVNNNFNRNANINRNASVRGGRNSWQHNPTHRGGTPYRDRATANKFGGTARGDSLANRQSGARQQLDRQGGQLGTRDRPGGAVGTGGVGNRPGAGGGGISNRPGAGGGGVNRPSTLPSNRPDAGGGVGNRPGAGGGGVNRPSTLPSSRPGGGVSGNRPTTLPSGGGADRVGSRDLSRSSGSSAFGGGSRGFDGGHARSSSSRGSSSMRSGGVNRGGGGGGGGGGRSRGGGRR